MGESAYIAYTIRDSPFHPRAKVQGREGGGGEEEHADAQGGK